MNIRAIVKTVCKQICPPFLWTVLSKIRNRSRQKQVTSEAKPSTFTSAPDKQQLSIYWDPEFAKVLVTWGEEHVWVEIQHLLVCCQGKVLDVACGTGPAIRRMSHMKRIDLYGFDISDLLIEQAVKKGIAPDRLKVTDATRLDYRDQEFDYSYSIGSLEHFTEDGLEQCLKENARVTRVASFHMVPISRSGKDEGWTERVQSYFNNSVGWSERKVLPGLQGDCHPRLGLGR